ncbi:MAG TPA: glycosyltransferase family 39 protein [Azospirillaceae bacterium]|nr:glycosyltransferase family 39 protein [Azospirillaceae bacterium]
MNHQTPYSHIALSGGLPQAGGLAMRAARLACDPWDDLTRLLLFGLAVLAALTFQDYGITTDELVQQNYGQYLWNFYASGFTDQTAFTYSNLYLYGGLFDLLAVGLQRVLPFGVYETRHLLCALFGIAGIAGTWRLARLLGGPRAGFLAAALLALTASYYGAMFNNTKDVPFAAGMVWAVYYVTRVGLQLPKPGFGTVVKLGVVIGLTLAIRIGGIFIGMYLAATIAAGLVLVWREEGTQRALRAAGASVTSLLPAVPVAYAVMGVFWPWGVMSPLNPLEALSTFRKFPFRLETLFEGNLVFSDQPPASYLPVYLGIKLPETALVGLVLAVVLAGWWVWTLARQAPAAGRFGFIDAADGTRRLLPVVLAAALPVVMFILMRPTVYNGIRHFMFVVPAMMVLAGLAFDRVWQIAETRHARLGQGFCLALTVAAVVHGWTMVRLHPNEYVYYNRLVGGLPGAAGRFELDYWSNSIREAVLALGRYTEMENGGPLPRHAYRVTVCANGLSASYFMPSHLKFVNDLPDEIMKADFFIIFNQDSDCQNLLNGRTIIEVARDGVPLSVVKDRRDITGTRIVNGVAGAAP